MKIGLKVKTGSKRDCVRIEKELLIVETTAQPHEGMANKKVIALLADYYKVSKSQVRIICGIKNHNKIVEINQ